MALILSAATGNFNAGATWVGGIVPGVGDEARASTTHVVTIQSTSGNIDDAASVTLTTAYQPREFFSDGADWHLI